MATFIDLVSDTATQPSSGMRAFMAQAPVGDEQKQEDPTVNALQDRVAALLGKEAALYLPSATMANEIAVKVHTQPGDKVILDETSHIVTSEAGGPAVLSGVTLHPLRGIRGVFLAEQVEGAIGREGPHYPPARLVSVEQTANLGGGTVWPIERLRALLREAVEGRPDADAIVEAAGVVFTSLRRTDMRSGIANMIRRLAHLHDAEAPPRALRDHVAGPPVAARERDRAERLNRQR